MTRPFLAYISAWLLALVISVASVVSVQAQTPTPPPRDAVIAEIKSYADRHVKNNSPMQTSLVVDLYRNNSAGLVPQEIARIYEEEYTTKKEALKPSVWEQFKPTIGWIAAGLLMLVLIFGRVLEKWITSFIEKVGNAIYGRWAGSKLLRRVALQQYQKSLIGKYQDLHIPFRPNRSLKMHEVYVPLKVSGITDGNQIDAYSAVAKYRRLMVKGIPGSGKSMLLKNIAFTYAHGRLIDLPDQPVPLLLELNRLSDPKLSLEQHLVEVFARNNFPHAEHFVARGLEQNSLMLLLDGLDEVNSHDRGRVVQQIKDVLSKYEECRVVITCRTAVYREEFNDIGGQTLEIVDFSDQQIRRFLGSWAADMPADKSIEQLMRTLHDRPQIMALARNPLLLTIIAYLYCDTDYVLPHSRAEFYRQSTDVLLRQWHQERNVFDARDKRLVLQHLALFFQDSADQRQEDRRTVDYQTVLQQVRQILPNLNLQPEQARPLLDEIVERSGLLLSIDGGERYSFAHLTLQEFFAAAELLEDANGLIRRFQVDPDTWRETVKLWCGLTSDSTALIQAIYAKDAITAFECLADARKVEPELVHAIVAEFKPQLGVAGEDDAIVRAFGTIAADQRPRGKAVFGFLQTTLAADADPRRRMAAANALSFTNVPQAAEVLAIYSSAQQELRAPLLRMGDLAVPSLGWLAQQGSPQAMDDLQAIGTPLAATQLLPLLWHEELETAYRAAWRLAAMLPLPNVEAVLRDYPLTEAQRRASKLDWIWQPFEEPATSALPVIAGRIALLLLQAPIEMIPTTATTLDPRLLIPILSIEAGNEFDPNILLYRDESTLIVDAVVKDISNYLSLPSISGRSLQRIQGRISAGFRSERFEALNIAINAIAHDNQDAELLKFRLKLTKAIISAIQPSSRCKYLFGCLPNNVQLELLQRLINRSRKPIRNDWLNVFRPSQYRFENSWHYVMVVSLAAITSLIAVVQILTLIYQSPILLTWVNGMLLSAVALVIWSWVAFLSGFPLENDPDSDSFLFMILLSPFTAVFALIEALGDFLKGRGDRGALLFVGILITLSPSPIVTMYFTTTTMLTFLSWPFAVLAWVLLVGIGLMLFFIGYRQEQAAQNPLQGILEPQAITTTPVRKPFFAWLFTRRLQRV